MSIQDIPDSALIGEGFDDYVQNLHLRHEHTPGKPGSLDGDMSIEALPTCHAGTTFRSALEAGWARTLDSLNIRWQYEPETITLPSGARYIPDFWLPELGTWLEVKGTGVPRVEKAVELGESRACRCEDACGCEWPGGQLVIVGHPPKPYDPYSDPEMENAPWRAKAIAARRHGGHPRWSTAHGPHAWLTRCNNCQRGGWITDRWCRACRGPVGRGSGWGVPAYASGDVGLRFLTVSGPPVAPASEGDDAA